ncbi:MAG: alpha/beta hydrolase [Deferribacteres bacterium]|nr:alpha/beta hydrolase [candidate division KSB1 bacterium]MCB9501904.1 alpha/beta hydrolase [Deferribacteres bacterium]
MPKSRLWKWISRILIVLAFLLLVFFLIVIPVFITHVMTHAQTRPMDLQIKTTPMDLGVAYNDVAFAVKTESAADSASISGWYLPKEDARGIIIYAHGLFRSRQEVLNRAVDLWNAGYAALLIDLRRHGKSTAAKSGMGYLERGDVLAAISFVKDSLKVQVPVITYGVSMGAVATLLANAETTDVDAIIIDSSFLSFDHTLDHHLKLWFGWPRFPVGTLISALAKWRIGFSSDDFDMRKALDKIGKRPVLFFAGAEDRRMPPAVARELATHCQGESELIIVPGARHGHAYDVDPSVFVNNITAFLDRVLKKE